MIVTACTMLYVMIILGMVLYNCDMCEIISEIIIPYTDFPRETVIITVSECKNNKLLS